jgi:plasmid stabilization system protein ParE
MSGYAFHPEAFADLDEIWEYIARDNIDAADRVVADIHSALRTLVASPHIGHRRPDLTNRPLRFHLVRDEYLLAYAPEQRPLWVVAVIDGRRNPRVIAAMLRGRETR